MRLLIKNVKIIDKDWNVKDERFDVSIVDGKIKQIGKNLDEKSFELIESSNLHMSIGFFDIGTQIGEPGFEHREDLRSTIKAASAGGYTGIANFPNTDPPIKDKSQVQYILKQTDSSIVQFYPIGKFSDGSNIHELLDMYENGAVAFSDGSDSIKNAGLMLRGLQYAKSINGLVINQPYDKSISPHGAVHESETSVIMGMEGIPEIAEKIMLERDVQINEYLQSRYCAFNISTKESCELIEKKKSENTNSISCTVNYLNLVFRDRDVASFNSDLKLIPPLREEEDRLALINGLRNGTVDAISSGHTPLEEELKKKAFANADFGATGLETAFSALLKIEDELGLSIIIEKLTIGPRNILGLEIPKIKEGETANLTLFDPEVEWNYNEDNIQSKSKNNPFLNQSFTGKVIGIFNKNKYHLS